MRNHLELEPPIVRIAREKSERIVAPPFHFLRRFDLREDAFQEAIAKTLEEYPTHNTATYTEVEIAFNYNASSAVSRIQNSCRREPVSNSELLDRQATSVQPPKIVTRDSVDQQRAVIDRERLLFVRMVLDRGFLPPDDVLVSAARGYCQEQGTKNPTESEIGIAMELLKEGKLAPRRRKTAERLADIDYYRKRTLELAELCSAKRQVQVASLAVASAMHQIRRLQRRSDRCKPHRPNETTAVQFFVDLREKMTLLATEYHLLCISDSQVGDRHSILGVLVASEMFSALFPRADQLGRCLRHSRLLVKETPVSIGKQEVGDEQLFKKAEALRQTLEQSRALAKIRKSDVILLRARANSLAEVMKGLSNRKLLFATAFLSVSWLRIAATLQPHREYDELANLDAEWWRHVSSPESVEFLNVLASVNRFYSSRLKERRLPS